MIGRPGARSFWCFGTVKRSFASFVSGLAPGKVSKMLPVPAHIKRPPYRDEAPLAIKTPDQIERMRSTGRLAAQILNFACDAAQV